MTGTHCHPIDLVGVAQAARFLIRGAERDGISIDDGNVVDLIADNIPVSLWDIRCALVVAGYGSRFSRAIDPG